eukprot:Amastigsp_a340232_193.p2 type:complete len:128 gc:universal Amastigsp_a340232_193:511-128(-)
MRAGSACSSAVDAIFRDVHHAAREHCERGADGVPHGVRGLDRVQKVLGMQEQLVDRRGFQEVVKVGREQRASESFGSFANGRACLVDKGHNLVRENSLKRRFGRGRGGRRSATRRAEHRRGARLVHH